MGAIYRAHLFYPNESNTNGNMLLFPKKVYFSRNFHKTKNRKS